MFTYCLVYFGNEMTKGDYRCILGGGKITKCTNSHRLRIWLQTSRFPARQLKSKMPLRFCWCLVGSRLPMQSRWRYRGIESLRPRYCPRRSSLSCCSHERMVKAFGFPRPRFQIKCERDEGHQNFSMIHTTASSLAGTSSVTKKKFEGSKNRNDETLHDFPFAVLFWEPPAATKYMPTRLWLLGIGLYWHPMVFTPSQHTKHQLKEPFHPSGPSNLPTVYEVFVLRLFEHMSVSSESQ